MHSHAPTNPGYKVWKRVTRCKQKMAARRTWNNDKVQALLATWSDASIQRQLLGTVRDTTVFNKIADELAGKSYQHVQRKAVSGEVEAAEEEIQRSFIKERIPWLHPNCQYCCSHPCKIARSHCQESLLCFCLKWKCATHLLLDTTCDASINQDT